MVVKTEDNNVDTELSLLLLNDDSIVYSFNIFSLFVICVLV